MSEPSAGKKPLAVYAVIDRKEGQRSIWVKIGAAFTNRDGSMSLLLDAFPIGTNRLQVREQRDWEARPAPANGQAEERP